MYFIYIDRKIKRNISLTSPCFCPVNKRLQIFFNTMDIIHFNIHKRFFFFMLEYCIEHFYKISFEHHLTFVEYNIKKVFFPFAIPKE